MKENIPNLKGIPRNSFELEEKETGFVILNLNNEEVGIGGKWGQPPFRQKYACLANH